MAHCPACGEGIDQLINLQLGTMVYKFSLHGYEEDEFIGGDEAGDYDCPECNTMLAQNGEDATAFLNGEGTSEEMAKYYLELALEGGK